jgi:hypothetical protein
MSARAAESWVTAVNAAVEAAVTHQITLALTSPVSSGILDCFLGVDPDVAAGSCALTHET